MSTPVYFRRRTIGRAASPPTWACYEQIPYDQEGYTSESASSASDSDHDDEDDDDNDDDAGCSEDDESYPPPAAPDAHPKPTDGSEDIDMDLDAPDAEKTGEPAGKQDVKGKQRAVDPPVPSPAPVPPPAQQRENGRRKKQQQRKQREPPVYALRPILTIHRSQGFVWNQDLFVPPYIKDRYVASTSPPNARGFAPASFSSTNSALTDYEVEVVEIRVREGELGDLIP